MDLLEKRQFSHGSPRSRESCGNDGEESLELGRDRPHTALREDYRNDSDMKEEVPDWP